MEVFELEESPVEGQLQQHKHKKRREREGKKKKKNGKVTFLSKKLKHLAILKCTARGKKAMQSCCTCLFE